MRAAESRQVALVLAGGGSLGAVQVGMLKALVAHGVSVDLIVGSSVGAVNGACFAADPSAATVARLEAAWRGVTRNDIFPINWRSLFGFARRRDHLCGSHGVRRLAERHLPYLNLEDAAVPIHVVATDLLSGKPVVLSRGNAADAIAASSAIPIAYAPVRVGGRYLIDGAVASNTPVRVAVSLGARRVIVLPTGFACNLTGPPSGAIANGLHALSLMIAGQLVSELEGLPRDIDYAIVPSLCPLSGSPYDFTNTGRMIDAAEISTRDWIEAGGLFRRIIPDQLRAHSHH